MTEIIRSGSQMFVVCLVGVWQRNFEPVVCVCVCVRYDGLTRLTVSDQPYRVLASLVLELHWRRGDVGGKAPPLGDG